MKIVLWIGNVANQKALANKINDVFKIEGIIIESRNYNSKITIKKLFEKTIEILFLPSIGKSWKGAIKYYNNLYPEYPSLKLLEVENINCQTAYEFTKEVAPDLIIVSGTRMIKDKMLLLKPSIGILNLHTGLSPYIKGGPNCTNWCIATRQFHFIGNTIMWIDSGIDTGNILTSDFTLFNGKENLMQIYIKVFDHAHDLYIKAIKKISTGSYPNVKQSEIAEGKTYYTKQWGLPEKINLIRNLKHFKKINLSFEIERLRQSIKTIKI